MARLINQSQNLQVASDLPKVVMVLFQCLCKTIFKEIRFRETTMEQFLSTHAGDVQAMFCSGATPVTGDILQKLPELRLVVTASTGVNHIDLSECHHCGIKVANAGAIFSEDVADMAVGLLIDVLRRISAANRFVKGRLWRRKGEYPLGSKLGGKRVGIVGLGSISLEVAKRLESFGCIISYNPRNKKPSSAYPFYSNVGDRTANSDILVICCALTDQTHHVIDKEVMLALGKEGIIVHIGPGAIIHEKELVQCLVKGEIAGAGLDVYENEPMVPEELFGLDNVVLSPHCAICLRRSLIEDLYELACGNLDAAFSNKPLMYQVQLG